MKTDIEEQEIERTTMDTTTRIQTAFEQARSIFCEKMANYGPAWLGLSALGFADQIYIKAHRYKTLICKKKRKVQDPPELELYAIINYCILFLIARNRKILAQIFDSPTAIVEPFSKNAQEKLIAYYQQEIEKTVELQFRKNHDYGSAWKGLTHEGIADILFAKTLRIKAMLSSTKTLLDDKDPDGIVANLRDLINYSAFALALN